MWSIRGAARAVSSPEAALARPARTLLRAIAILACLLAPEWFPAPAPAASPGSLTPPCRFVEASAAKPIRPASSSTGALSGRTATVRSDTRSSVVRLNWRRRRPYSWTSRGVASERQGEDHQIMRVSGVELIPASPPNELKVRTAAQLAPLDPFSDPFGDSKSARRRTAQLAPAEPIPPADSFPPVPLTPSPSDALEDEYSSDSGGDDCQSEIGACRKEFDDLAENPITNISVDITPLFRPDIQEVAESIEDTDAKQKSLSKESVRSWNDRSGHFIATGQLVDFRDDRVHIQKEDGRVVEIATGRLSPEDICYLTEIWNLPTECKLREASPPRRDAWLASTLTWKAPNTCSKPLYFQEPRLERYGHSSGRILQPVVSGAHFFLNIAALPYKMGINPPMECRYPLGYYEPGDCAPYLVPPFPVSLRGGLLEAGAVTGAVFALP